ncbi:carbon storage regulator CsrA [Paenibacillus polymyxa]|uniref:carbon storage regulator CsrA n=1 Tax=Paenibacillus TaxID=44249 RepID=UPI000F4EE330|nr:MULTISPECIES: carbon storage regulator CsrA [Paenibacillus]KAF6656843.1 carbon storage regulator CsrA [Paenibacillus sp. EKM301P]RPD96972.1 carbon storage regulator [Paenibacillus polymyxa]UBS86865.1 carbon storage regulator CsrA [Paenibacillus polymyxa]WHX35441.1 carbon storage regulator CsrA [Paenibacillus polymyxa]
MLVLSRKKGESIIIQDHIEVTVLGVEGDTVRIGISAPKQMDIFRKEIYLCIQESNRESAAHTQTNLDALRKMINKNNEK